jgi:Na+-translocating ferredoxin:NAD+ oxidoreductase RnfG subunit
VAAAVAIAALWSFASASAQERVYLTHEEAVERALRGARDVRTETITLSLPEAVRLAEETNVGVMDSTYVFHSAYRNGRRERSVVIMNVLGQYEMITFYVAIGATGSVQRAEIMTYRESRGSEVRRRAFLEQFENKTRQDPLTPGGDIRNVSGATISSRAVSRGVRLALELHALLPPREGNGDHQINGEDDGVRVQQTH